MILLPHLPILWILCGKVYLAPSLGPWAGAASFALRLLLVCVFGITSLFLHIMPFTKGVSSKSVSAKRVPSGKLSAGACPASGEPGKASSGSDPLLCLRLKVMTGGRAIIRLCFWGLLFQVLVYLLKPPGRIAPANIPWPVVLIGDGIFAFLYFYLLILNGCIRILCTCRSLGVWKRVCILCFLWIPVLHLFLARYLCKRAWIEYDAERCRFENRLMRADSQICATRYPLVMLHGIGFRDLRYFNYWGRIPRELVRNGAVVYYGHQQAWGTIEGNAEIIREKIGEILRENHCGRVNIIAHSKGGLDARYLISGLHMEDQVASLTTISTPHRGSELLNLLNRLPDPVYRFVASLFDRAYARFGDQNPDCYHASKQLSPEFCREFNEQYPDSAKVYYQSYASCMKHTLGDGLLSIPNLLMFLAGAGANDGLVTEQSARWGNFRTTFQSGGRRGISHGDMIDLKREDYKGFDVVETYVQIVADLKARGF